MYNCIENQSSFLLGDIAGGVIQMLTFADRVWGDKNGLKYADGILA